MNRIEILKTQKFDSEIQFKEFEKKFDNLILSKKLALLDSETFRDISFKKYKDSENNIYCLSEPDLYWRGFFLDYNSSIEYIEKLKKADEKKRSGCIMFILIVFLIATILIIFK